jgi:hypothetical protein
MSTYHTHYWRLATGGCRPTGRLVWHYKTSPYAITPSFQITGRFSFLIHRFCYVCKHNNTYLIVILTLKDSAKFVIPKVTYKIH